mmetsp:Transcript_7396/g.6742  ORF Transcript_7396/g.6742 Transcript_7396/m.6742 type:complete len:85 (-) Transcript_7396:148-402(-)
MCVNGNKGSEYNYNNHVNGGGVDQEGKGTCPFKVSGDAGRHKVMILDDDFTQAGELYRKVMNDTQRQHLIENICGALKDAKKEI